MPTCYAITAGSYSDYRVCAVFTTRELAESECFMYGAGVEVEEFPLDPVLPKPPAGMHGFFCFEKYDTDAMTKDTTAIDAYRKHGRDMPESNVGLVWTDSLDFLAVNLWARDKSHAIKIASEKFAQYRAIQAGVV